MAPSYAATSSGDTWTIWADGTSSATSNSITAESVWSYWTDDAGTTSGASTTDVWAYWTDARQWQRVKAVASRELTEEEKKAQRQRQEQARLEREQLEKDRQEAEAKAEALLQEVLDEVQKEMYAKEKQFIVQSQSGRIFRIHKGWSGNVKELDPETEQVIASYCIHPEITVPHADNMVIQKLMLELEEARFLQIANRTEVIRPLAA